MKRAVRSCLQSLLVLGAAVAANAGETNIWARGSGADALASNPANWSLRHAPLSNEVVRLTRGCSRAIVWDDKASPVVSGWIQEAGYVAVATINTTPKAGGFNTFSVLGDFIVKGGAVTHPANGDAEDWWLSLDVAGNVIVGENAFLSASGKGYASGKGPSPGVTPGSGASHGGQGAPCSMSTNTMPARTYDSIINPVMSGSGGTTLDGSPHSYNGGGSIVIKAGGKVIVDGSISANADSRDIDGTNIGGAAGGSVNIRARGKIEGNGSITANGGRGYHKGAGGGGGGRIALVSSGWNQMGGKRLSAYGGCGETATPESPVTDRHIRGAAGTVYVANLSLEPDAGGVVSISDWHRPSLASTRIPSDMHPDVNECRDAALSIEGNGFATLTASTSVRELKFSGGGIDLNRNTLVVGFVRSSSDKNGAFETPGTYTSPPSRHFDPVIFQNGSIVVRTYFKPIF